MRFILYSGLAFLLSLLISLKLSAQETSEFLFINRKLNQNAHELIGDARLNITEYFKDSRRFSRILDFNFGDASLREFNLIPSAGLERDYGSLSESEKEELFFKKYLKRLLAARKSNDPSSRLIHIDHHYASNLLSRTSSSVLALDFVLWLHDAHEDSRISNSEFNEALQILVNSVPLLDHADADIIISNFVISQAGEIKFLRKWAPQLKSVALYNDYLKRSFADSRAHQKSILIWTALRTLENLVLNSQLVYSQADQLLRRILEWAEQIDAESSGNLVEFAARRIGENKNKFSPAELFLTSYLETEKQREVFRKVFSQSLGQIFSAQDLHFGRAYSRDGILLTMLEAQAFEMESSALVDYLLISRPEIAARHRLALSVSVHPETKATFVKMRALDPDLDLSLAIQRLKEAGFNSGGRAQAGSAAYGTTGIFNISLVQLQADLFRILQIMSAELDCKNELKDLGLKPPSKAL